MNSSYSPRHTIDKIDYTYTNVEPCTNYYTVDLNINEDNNCSYTPCKGEDLAVNCSCRADDDRDCLTVFANKVAEINK